MILNRRSVRSYIDSPVSDEIIEKLIVAASYAPSGKNGQPWRFVVIKNKEIIRQIAKLTVYSRFIASTPCLIAVFLDQEKSYDVKKDTMAIGAAIQNILLTAEAQELASCWIGEVLSKENVVKTLLEIGDSFSLMAVISIGKSAVQKSAVPKRHSVCELLIKTI